MIAKQFYHHYQKNDCNKAKLQKTNETCHYFRTGIFNQEKYARNRFFFVLFTLKIKGLTFTVVVKVQLLSFNW
jgi:hypothetical protein